MISSLKIGFAVSLFAAPLAMVAQQLATPTDASVYQLPEAKKIKMPNGLVVLLVEKHDLPLTAVSLVLRSGSLMDPDGKPGVSAITQELLRRGTPTRTAAQMASEIDFIGMQFGGGGGGGRGGGGGAASSYNETDIAADFLAKDTDKALNIFAAAVHHLADTADVRSVADLRSLIHSCAKVERKLFADDPVIFNNDAAFAFAM